MVTDGSYSCGEHSTMFREVGAPSCTPETKVVLCVNYTQKTPLKSGQVLFSFGGGGYVDGAFPRIESVQGFEIMRRNLK